MIKNRQSRYFSIEWDSNRYPNFEVINADRIQNNHPYISVAFSVSWPDGIYKMPRHPGRIPEYLETPRFLFHLKPKQNLIDAFVFDGLWVISDEMKSFLESVDPTACAYHKCEAIFSRDNEIRTRWICSVERAFSARDVVEMESDSGLQKSLGPDGDRDFTVKVNLSLLQFRPEALRNAHLFWLLQFSQSWHCDETFRNAYKSSGLTGLRFVETPEETLDQKIAKLEKRAATLSRQRNASRWTDAQEKLAFFLSLKGRSEPDDGVSRRACEAYQSAIDGLREGGNLIAAAELQVSLGDTLRAIGAKHDDTNALASASSVFHEIIEFFENPPSSVAAEYATASPKAQERREHFASVAKSRLKLIGATMRRIQSNPSKG